MGLAREVDYLLRTQQIIEARCYLPNIALAALACALERCDVEAARILLRVLRPS